MATSTFEVHRIELAAQPADFTGKMREAAGFTVFTEIDHAAAKKFGLDMAVGRARAAAAIAVRARQPSDPTGRSRGTLLLEQLSN